MIKVIAWYDNEWGYSCRLATWPISLPRKVYNPVFLKKVAKEGGASMSDPKKLRQIFL